MAPSSHSSSFHLQLSKSPFVMSNMPELNRAVSDSSQWTEDAEKYGTKHQEVSIKPGVPPITEEEEGGNVGLAAYLQSKELGEVVSYLSLTT